MFDQFNNSQKSIQGIKELIKYRSSSTKNDVADYSTVVSKIDHIWKVEYSSSQATILEN